MRTTYLSVLAAGVLLPASLSAALTPTDLGLFNTGVNEDGTAFQSGGSADAHYDVTVAPQPGTRVDQRRSL